MEFFMCFSILLYVWINNLNHVVCYGTLIITSKTKVESSSIYSQGLYSGDANKTIDGNTAQDYKNCMHTALSQSEAWLKIDLGSVFNVKSIKIWYRNDRGVGTTKRLRGFSILVSNNSDFDVNDTCYQDPGNIHLETVLEVNCSRSAQYVKIYTNKNNDGGVILEICEVKIYGCGHCAKNAVCDQDNGSCPGGHCEPGWKHANDLRCDQECENGTFGLYCQSNCSDKCAKGQSCNKANGFCQGGCENGWTIHNCTENELVVSGYTRTKSSSVYHYNGYIGYADKTVDGNIDQKQYSNCMHTDIGQEKAWLRVDLRILSIISSVKLWYRNDHTIPNFNTRRMKGFNIRLTNTTRKNQQKICYEDDGKSNPPTIIKAKCEGVAQYVWIYTNISFKDGAILEICEVQVYGCPYQDSDGKCISCDGCRKDCDCENFDCRKAGYRPQNCSSSLKCTNGTYGHGCKSTCGHCANNTACDHVHGSCPNGKCEPGWESTQDWKCDKECKNGTYGHDCKGNCGHCANNIVCDHIDGSCPNRKCVPGWKSTAGGKCDKECKNGTYGHDCKGNCGHCANNTVCDHIDGSCPNRKCAPGWKSTQDTKCDKECKNGTYGHGCSSTCGHCANNTACNHVTGSCPNSKCAPGWENTEGGKCEKECRNGTYGHNCKENCGHCANNTVCDHIDGSCPNRKCAPGWESTQDTKCDKECKNGTYGHGCSSTCGHCANENACDHVTGSCPNRKCAPGWESTEGEKCEKACKPGLYGMDCSRSCGHCQNNSTCNHVTGSCPTGYCEPGWKHTKEKRCDQECENGTFGYYCRGKCSRHCADGFPCDKVDGICREGCADGWINPHCNESCTEGLYGRNCSLKCGHCAENKYCNHVNGSCPSGSCEPGWKHTEESRCNQACDNGTFGYHCIHTCSGNCAGGSTCTKADGTCPRGCTDGWINERCNETCSKKFYGKGCKENCGHCGGAESCHHIDGFCPGLCEPGYYGKKCNTECYNGTFGLRCNFTCSEGCVSVCNKINGSCDHCHYGYIGEFCNITVAEVQAQESTAAAAGVGAFLLILVIIVIVLAVVLAKKARRKKEGDIDLQERKGTSNNVFQENNIDDNTNKTENAVPIEGTDDIEYIVTDNGQMKTLIKIADLGKIIKMFSMEENKKFTEEFKGIPYGEQQHIPCSVAKLQQNMPKNRYKTTFPYDHSRVVLNVSPDNDYINANYIKDVEGKRRYIATQGPRKNTVQDFWEMIWQENIRVIVMVTKLTEGSTVFYIKRNYINISDAYKHA
ncbi:multiple epidermal growth factor-like domains protein 6 [Saccostrea cucullata]|uniref:multiple epidermal growth factor-like domains protein 6 n=1 Tax=Saccostrea cuccullata TaxID=36930 RepID=UPI002ED42742